MEFNVNFKIELKIKYFKCLIDASVNLPVSPGGYGLLPGDGGGGARRGRCGVLCDRVTRPHRRTEAAATVPGQLDKRIVSHVL